MLRLPEELRDAFKDPLGPVYTDVEALLSEIDRVREDVASDPAATAAEETDAKTPPAGMDAAPLVAVGDVVTYHIRGAGREPDVAVVDGRTEREAVDPEIEGALANAGEERVAVANPPAELTTELLEAVRDAIVAPEPTVIEVDGEEDLAALPAIVAAPVGASVVYGQPGEGMVHVPVTRKTIDEALQLLRGFEGDVDRAVDVLTS